MMAVSLLLSAYLADTLLTQNYKLMDSYAGHTFFDGFNFSGYRQHNTSSNFQNKSSAQKMGLINTTSTTAYIGTDYTNIVNISQGRPSLELTSIKTYANGLFILDALHLPQGCGTWPAWWLYGTSPPYNGEIDIIEGINLSTDDQTTLHTYPSSKTNYTTCDYSTQVNDINMTGKFMSYNCTIGPHPGCYVEPNINYSFGIPFNKKGGGVYALDWNDDIGIRSWFWLHEDVPDDIIQKKPDPSLWGLPYAYFPFGSWCSSNHFNSMNIMIDLYYCGWSGNDPSWKTQCGTIANNQTCEYFVANNPNYFIDAYWLINYIDVYQLS